MPMTDRPITQAGSPVQEGRPRTGSARPLTDPHPGARPTTADLTQEDIGVLGGGEDAEGEELTSRPTTTNRLPSQMAQARFSRTPAGMESGDFSSDEDDSLECPEGSRFLDDRDSVYLTEVAHPDDHVPEGFPSGPRPPSTPPPILPPSQFNDSDFYDTDIEDLSDCEGHIDRDTTGRATYQAVCERLGLVPVSYFVRNIEERELVMKYHSLGAKGMRAMATALKENITIEKFDISGNWIEAEGGKCLAKTLVDNDYITHLVAADNKLRSEGAFHMMKMLHLNTVIRVLDLSGNEIRDCDAQYIASALEENKTLKELYLSRNQLGEAAGVTLGPSIASNDILEVVDLSWNQIRRTGAVAIAEGIAENIRLKCCDLSWNGLGVEGGAAIADAIARNEALQELDISGNRLDPHSAAQVASGLKKNESLECLKMGNNPITTSGCISLAAALRAADSSALKRLNLTDIPVEYEYLRTVRHLAEQRGFQETHGAVLRSGNTPSDLTRPPLTPALTTERKDPLLVLREHIIVNDLRIIDLLKKYDVNETYNVTPEQFATALEELGVKLNKEELDNIASKLRQNEEGKIYYGDLVNKIEAAGGEPFQRPPGGSTCRSAQSRTSSGLRDPRASATPHPPPPQERTGSSSPS